MTNILIIALSILTFLGQLGFSIYYSIKIVDLNAKVNQVQTSIEQKRHELELSKINFLTTNSLDKLSKELVDRNYQPIQNILKIQ